jgi:hypothetical protein
VTHEDVTTYEFGINVQNRLVQFGGSPGVGLTEYHLAVSGPFSCRAHHVVTHWEIQPGRRLVGLTSPPPFGGVFFLPKWITLTWWEGLLHQDGNQASTKPLQ